MRKIILTMLSATMLSGVAHADIGVKESTAWYGELVHKWETTNKNTWTGFNSATEQQIVSDAAYAQWTWKNPNDGWCNEAVVWAMNNVGMFQGDVYTVPQYGQTMRGRDFTSHYNSNVTEHWNHNDEWTWDDVRIGAVALMDWQSSPSTAGNLGVDHTTTFMGVVEGTDYGWFLGGNQSGRLQPKLYKLDDMTFASDFNDSNADVKKHYYYDMEEYGAIDLEDGNWSQSAVSGWAFGTHQGPKWDGTTNSKFMSKQWKQHAIPMTKFQNGDNVVYLEGDYNMEVFTRSDGSKQLIRSIDYSSHVEIDEIEEHIDANDANDSTTWQNYGQWYRNKGVNANRNGFRNYIVNNDFEDSQWHKEVYTAVSIRDAVEEWDGESISEISRSLYIDYDISYDNDEEDLETHAFD